MCLFQRASTHVRTAAVYSTYIIWSQNSAPKEIQTDKMSARPSSRYKIPISTISCFLQRAVLGAMAWVEGPGLVSSFQLTVHLNPHSPQLSSLLILEHCCEAAMSPYPDRLGGKGSDCSAQLGASGEQNSALPYGSRHLT